MDGFADINVVLGALLAAQTFSVGFLMQRLDAVFERAILDTDETLRGLSARPITDLLQLYLVKTIEERLDREQQLSRARSLVGAPILASLVSGFLGFRIFYDSADPRDWLAALQPDPSQWQSEPTGMLTVVTLTVMLGMLAYLRSRQLRRAVRARTRETGLKAVERAAHAVAQAGGAGSNLSRPMTPEEIDDEARSAISEMRAKFPAWHWTDGLAGSYWQLKCIAELRAYDAADAVQDVGAARAHFASARRYHNAAVAALSQAWQAEPDEACPHLLRLAALASTAGRVGWHPNPAHTEHALKLAEQATALSKSPLLTYRAAVLRGSLLERLHDIAAADAATQTGFDFDQAERMRLAYEAEVDQHYRSSRQLRGPDEELALSFATWTLDRHPSKAASAARAAARMLNEIATSARTARSDEAALELGARLDEPLQVLLTARDLMTPPQFERATAAHIPQLLDVCQLGQEHARRQLRRATDPDTDLGTLVRLFHAHQHFVNSQIARARLSILVNPVRRDKRPIRNAGALLGFAARQRLARLQRGLVALRDWVNARLLSALKKSQGAADVVWDVLNR